MKTNNPSVRARFNVQWGEVAEIRRARVPLGGEWQRGKPTESPRIWGEQIINKLILVIQYDTV